MKSFTQITFTLAITLGMSATALAGDPKQPAAGAPAPAAKKEAAPTPAAKKEATPAPDAKKAAPEAPKKVEAPKPPQEVAALLKVMGGSWKCAGKVAMDPTDMTKLTDVKMTMTMKADLDKWWIQGTLTGSGPMKMRGAMFATYDPTMKKWYRTMVDNMGGSESSWSDGMKDNKVVWTGEGRGMGMGAFKVKTTEETVSPKEVKMTGEMSMDGKKWVTGWESSCKK